MMNVVRGLIALSAALALAGEVHAWHHRPATVASYYYPVPAAYAPGFPVVYPMPPMPVAPVQVMPPLYAAPVPAPALENPLPPCPAPTAPTSPPPSTPPATMPPAGVSETPSVPQRTNYYAGPSGTAGNRPAPRLYSVTFWNRSSGDLTLRINGAERVLARGRGLALDLPREFTWQIAGRPEQVERIPFGESAVELILRR